MMALELQPGDEVITTPFTFIATAEVIALLGLKPVFVDINPHTFNMDENLIEAAITEKTKAMFPSTYLANVVRWITYEESLKIIICILLRIMPSP
jgi:UDP-2-acetamido-2-deoxy-ribo-hexuluronate aminotransferase